MNWRNFFQSRGESLSETVISIFIISFSIVTATTLVVASLKTNNASKERLIAINLAREGIEAIHFVRDTNWMQFSRDRRVCWNNNPSLGDCIDVGGNDVSDNAIEPGLYRVDFDPVNYDWGLSNTPDPSDIDNNILYLEDGLYTHRSQDSGGADNVPTDFRRTIEITYLQDDGTVGNTSDNRMEVRSTVVFLEESRQNSVELVTRLSDYFGRDPNDP